MRALPSKPQPMVKTPHRPSSSKLVSAAIALFIAALTAWGTLFFSNTNSLLNDWDDLRWTFLPAQESSHIFLIDIDETSLANHGRWPWPRTKLADLLHNLLSKYQAAVVGVDIILSESGDSQGNQALAALDKERVVWAQAASLGDEPIVDRGTLVSSPACPDNSPWQHAVRGWLGLTPTIAGSDFRAGHIRPWPDSDQVVRNYQPFLPHGTDCIPALGLAMYAALLGIPTDAPLTASTSGWLWGGIPLNLEDSGLLRLTWRTSAIKAIPAQDILSGSATLPANAVVVIGSSAVGIGDFVSIPGVERFVGVGVHALAFHQWLERDFISTPNHHDLWVWLLLSAVFLIFWLTSKKGATRPWLMALLLFIGWNLLALGLWTKSIYLATEPMLWALLWLPPMQGMRLWQEKKISRRIYDQFHAYLPEKVLQQLIDSEVDPRQLDAESREITVLFADLRGFTSLSENMAPREVVNLLNEVMEYLSGHIGAHDGTLDKFMGDSVMAFWGAPVPMADHADKGVACAIAMLDNLEILNDKLRGKGLPAVSLGIGINSGQVAVGNMGSINRKNYSAVGDAVNIASRLQQASRNLNCHLLIGADSAALCRENALVMLKEIEVKGKKNRVTVFTAAKHQPQES